MIFYGNKNEFDSSTEVTNNDLSIVNGDLYKGRKKYILADEVALSINELKELIDSNTDAVEGLATADTAFNTALETLATRVTALETPSSSGGESGGTESGGAETDTPSGELPDVSTIGTPVYDTTTYPSYILASTSDAYYYIALTNTPGTQVRYAEMPFNLILSSDSNIGYIIYSYNNGNWSYMAGANNGAKYTTLPAMSLTIKGTNLTIVNEATVTIPSSDAQLSMSAKEIVDDMGVGIGIGCTYESFGTEVKTKPAVYTADKADTADITTDTLTAETFWGNPVLYLGVFEMIKKSGFKTVRIPITWGNHVNQYGKIDSRWMDRIEHVVKLVLSLDMYCIINMHHDTNSGWLNSDSDTYSDIAPRFEGLWKQIAARFKNYGGKLLFEGFNEIIDLGEKWDNPSEADANVCNSLNQLFVNTVRNSGGNNARRHLICSAFATSCSEYSLKWYRPVTDNISNHIIAQVHCYDAFETKITRAYNMIYGEYDIPIILGEFGIMANQADTTTRKAEFSKITALCKDLQYVAPIYWSDACGFNYTEQTIPNYAIYNYYTLTPFFTDMVKEMIESNKTLAERYMLYNSDADYTSLQQLLADTSLTAGTIATTAGYYTSGDGGAGEYIITNTNQPYTDVWGYETNTDNTFDTVKLQNGLYAKLVTSKLTSLPMILGGVKPGATNLYKRIQCMSYRIHKLGLTTIPSYWIPGTYYLDGCTRITSCNWVGDGDVNIVIDEAHYNYNANSDFYMTTGDDIDTDMVLKGINIRLETSSGMYQHQRALTEDIGAWEMYVWGVRGFKNITIDNVKMEIVKATTNGIYEPTTCMQIREKSDRNSVTITNSIFKCQNCDAEDKYLTANNVKNSANRMYTAGGALWFHYTNIDTVNISNCEFYGSTTDEVFAMYGSTSQYRQLSNVNISNCKFDTSGHQSDNMFTIAYTHDSNVTVTDCEFTANVSVSNAFKVFANTNNTVKLKDSTFTLNTNCTSIWSRNSAGNLNIALVQFRGNPASGDYYYTAEFAKNTYSAEGCTFNCPSGTEYRYLVHVWNTAAKIKDCIFNGGMNNNGLGSYDSVGFKMEYENCEFNPLGTNFVILNLQNGATRPQILVLNGCKFKGNMYRIWVGKNCTWQVTIVNTSFNFTATNKSIIGIDTSVSTNNVNYSNGDNKYWVALYTANNTWVTAPLSWADSNATALLTEASSNGSTYQLQSIA